MEEKKPFFALYKGNNQEDDWHTECAEGNFDNFRDIAQQVGSALDAFLEDMFKDLPEEKRKKIEDIKTPNKLVYGAEFMEGLGFGGKDSLVDLFSKLLLLASDKKYTGLSVPLNEVVHKINAFLDSMIEEHCG